MWASTSGRRGTTRTRLVLARMMILCEVRERHRWTWRMLRVHHKVEREPQEAAARHQAARRDLPSTTLAAPHTPGWPTVTVERAGAVVCKRATPHRARRRVPGASVDRRETPC